MVITSPISSRKEEFQENPADKGNKDPGERNQSQLTAYRQKAHHGTPSGRGTEQERKEMRNNKTKEKEERVREEEGRRRGRNAGGRDRGPRKEGGKRRRGDSRTRKPL